MEETKRMRMDNEKRCITVIAHPNIALIKYWGKASEDNMIPLNDSISLTIDCLEARTSLVATNDNGENDSLVINGKNIELNHRFIRVFKEARSCIGSSTWSFSINSTTNFPIAAGLASSAAGFAAIAYAIGKAFDLPQQSIIRMARYGSGSACRSLLSGLVQWKRGNEIEESTIESHFGCDHWKELRLVVIVVKEEEKAISSKEGMKRGVETSRLIHERVRRNDERIRSITNSFSNRDFSSLAQTIMRDSNEMHAICMDSYPPISYLNPTSWLIINMIHSFNNDNIKAAYTFDAGPNACVFTLEEHLQSLLSLISSTFSYERGDTKEDKLDSRIVNLTVSSLGQGPQIDNKHN